MSNTETKTIYRQLGISEDVWIYGQPLNRRKKHMRLMKHRSDALLFMKERS